MNSCIDSIDCVGIRNPRNNQAHDPDPVSKLSNTLHAPGTVNVTDMARTQQFTVGKRRNSIQFVRQNSHYDPGRSRGGSSFSFNRIPRQGL